MASPATALNQAGQPAATCSPSMYLCKLLNLKLNDSPFELGALPDSPNSLPPQLTTTWWWWWSPFFLKLGCWSIPTRARPDPDKTEWSRAGVTDTACFELTQPILVWWESGPSGTESGRWTRIQKDELKKWKGFCGFANACPGRQLPWKQTNKNKKLFCYLYQPKKGEEGKRKAWKCLFWIVAMQLAIYPPFFLSLTTILRQSRKIDRMETPESTEGKKHQTIMTMMMGIITHHPWL